MNYTFTFLSVILLITALIALYIALESWRRRSIQGVLYLSLLEFGVSLWALAAVFETAAITIPVKLFWTQVSYLGIATVPPLYLLFALAYSGYNKYLTPRHIALLFIVPVITLTAVSTNNWHHDFYPLITIIPESNIALYEHGFWFWIHTTFSYLLLVTGIIIFSRTIFHLPSLRKSQVTILLIGAALPFAGNIIYVFKLNPVPGLDWTPIAFGLSGLVLALGIFRFHLLNLLPVAHSKLIETLSDGVMIIDVQGRIADLNPAMLTLLNVQGKQSLIGKHVNEKLSDWPELLNYMELNHEIEVEIEREEAGTINFFDLRILILKDKDIQKPGKLILLRNITERTLAERELKENEFFLKESQRVSQLGSYVLNFRTGLWTSSEILDTLFGIDKDYTRTLEGLLAIVHPDMREEMKAYLNETIVSKRHPFDKEYRIKKINDQSERWVHGLGEIEEDEEGNLKRLIGTIRDITERKQAEFELKKKIAQLEQMNQYMVDRELKMVDLKKEINALYKQLGQSPKYPSFEDDDLDF